MVTTSLSSYRQHLQASKVYVNWAKQSPGEAQKINAYWDGDGRPTDIRSEFGLSFLAAADAYREASAPPPPTTVPPMPYPVAPVDAG